MGLFRVLFVFLVIYILWRLFRRFVLPWLLQRFVKKATERMQDQMKQQFDHDQPKEGEVNIKHNPKSKGHIGDDEGEYVDFEEVD